MAGCEVCLYGTYDCPCCETGRYHTPSHCEDCEEEYEECICEENWYKLHHEFVGVGGVVSAHEVKLLKALGYAIEKAVLKIKDQSPKTWHVWVKFTEDVVFDDKGTTFTPTSVWTGNELGATDVEWSITRDFKTANVMLYFKPLDVAEKAYKILAKTANYLEEKYKAQGWSKINPMG